MLRRALRTEGELTHEALAVIVGASYWEDLRFEHALAAAIDDGFVVRTSTGRLAAV